MYLWRTWQHYSLRQLGRLSCEGSTKGFGGPRLGHVRNEPLWGRCLQWLFDWYDRKPLGMGDGRRDPNVTALRCWRSARTGPASQPNVLVDCQSQHTRSLEHRAPRACERREIPSCQSILTPFLHLPQRKPAASHIRLTATVFCTNLRVSPRLLERSPFSVPTSR